MAANELILRLIGDATSLFRENEAAISSNTKVAKSFERIGEVAQVSAKAEVVAGEKAIAITRARIAELSKLQASSAGNADAQAAATVALGRAQDRLNRQLGISTVATASYGAQAAKTGERDLGKLTRGLLAGSGAASSLGRSLAFASTGFIAIAAGSTLITAAVRAAETYEATLRKVDAQLKTSGKSFAGYRSEIERFDLKLSHLSGFSIQELLQSFSYLIRVGGNVKESLKLVGVAADVARGRNISLDSASIALSKALSGNATALKKLGVPLGEATGRMQILDYVQRKFAGQAKAGATAADHFHAAISNASIAIGTQLLPTITPLISGFTRWINKMTETGRLGRDVKSAVDFIVGAFHALGKVIGVVDRVTGSFGTTLKVVLEIGVARLVLRWVAGLEKLAVEWGIVGAAATKAGAEQEAALSAGGAGGIAGAGRAGFLGRFGPALGFALGGQLLGQVAGQHFGSGSGGTALGRGLQFAGIGAGIGSFIGPEGTAAGAGLGLLAGAVTSLIHSGPSFTTQMANMASGVDQLGKAAKQSRLDVLGLQAGIASGRVDVTGAQKELRAAEAEERATRGTATHAQALARLANARYNLARVTQQLATSEAELNRKQQQAAAQADAQKKHVTDLIKQLGTLAQLARTTPATGPGLSQDGFSAPFGLHTRIVDTYVLGLEKLEAQLKKQDPAMAKFVERLIAIARLYGEIPNSKELRLLINEQISRQFSDVPHSFPGSGHPSGQPAPATAPSKPSFTKNFPIPYRFQLAQAEAQLTKSMADDVAVAIKIIRYIKKALDEGILHGQAKLQALQEELQAQQVIDAARQAAQQKAQEAAAKRQAAIQAAIENSINPIGLQIDLARDQAFGRSVLKDLEAMRAAAEKALRSGKLNKQQILEAYQQITSLNQQIADALSGAAGGVISLKLQLALAKAQALGTDQTHILLKMKAALERALKKTRGNLQAQIDIYNQIYSINQQLQQGDQSFLGLFKQASTKALTAGINLTAAQRKILRARLSQLGPGGTTPGEGVGAEGYAIDPNTGRPISLHHHHHRRMRRLMTRSSRTPASYAGDGGGYLDELRIDVHIHPKNLAHAVTTTQQVQRKRNPRQRRGPNAGG